MRASLHLLRLGIPSYYDYCDYHDNYNYYDYCEDDDYYEHCYDCCDEYSYYYEFYDFMIVKIINNPPFGDKSEGDTPYYDNLKNGSDL